MIIGCPNAHSDPGAPDGSGAVPVLRPIVLAEIPHDPTAYTEGLELDGPNLYESTGIMGQSPSQLRELDPATGVLRRAAPVPHGYFGEGITVVGNRIWQLTYRDGVAVEWDKASLAPVREVALTGEGWGLCRDGDRLVRSDGSSRLHYQDPADFTETGSVSVTRDGTPVNGLNELECVDGQVWANVWPSDEIVRIDPATGLVNEVVDATGLLPGPRPRADVLNGIAHFDAQEFLLTGKCWPLMFRVHFDPAQ
ncbi:MAG TPA: glutaminyl-peptide cyclotransferase [Mycobacterium sp.]|nr:glutaminyl-peptide cyclotransferase [Mycobacterium sp.]